MAAKIREIILDTETTGLYAKNGDKIIEIGCVELVNRSRTGRTFHKLINPEREISIEATRVHGIENSHLIGKPKFLDIVDEFLAFIGEDSSLVIHNAGFDMSFINTELSLCGKTEISNFRVIDTLNMARKKFPGSPASLDALCKRFKISLESREKHGALIDAELLSSVYIMLTGGAQSAMNLVAGEIEKLVEEINVIKKERPYRNFALSLEELEEHKKLLEKLTAPLWNSN